MPATVTNCTDTARSHKIGIVSPEVHQVSIPTQQPAPRNQYCVPRFRVAIVKGLVEDYGLAMAEVARQVGISTSGVSKILGRSLSS